MISRFVFVAGVFLGSLFCVQGGSTSAPEGIGKLVIRKLTETEFLMMYNYTPSTVPTATREQFFAASKPDLVKFIPDDFSNGRNEIRDLFATETCPKASIYFLRSYTDGRMKFSDLRLTFVNGYLVRLISDRPDALHKYLTKRHGKSTAHEEYYEESCFENGSMEEKNEKCKKAFSIWSGTNTFAAIGVWMHPAAPDCTFSITVWYIICSNSIDSLLDECR